MDVPLLRISLLLPDQSASVPFCRRICRSALAELAVDGERAADVELAVSEAATNVVRHAYLHRGYHYQITVEVFANALLLIVEDEGRGFDRPGVPDPVLESAGGRGLWLIEQVADAVEFLDRKCGGSRLEARFHLTGSLSLPEDPPTPRDFSGLDDPLG